MNEGSKTRSRDPPKWTGDGAFLKGGQYKWKKKKEQRERCWVNRGKCLSSWVAKYFFLHQKLMKSKKEEVIKEKEKAELKWFWKEKEFSQSRVKS